VGALGLDSRPGKTVSWRCINLNIFVHLAWPVDIFIQCVLDLDRSRTCNFILQFCYATL